MNMSKFNITYKSRNYGIELMVTVLAYSIKTAAAEFHTFAGALTIVKIEPAK